MGVGVMTDEKKKTDGSTCLVYTELCGELEHLKIETRLIVESFECVLTSLVFIMNNRIK